MGPFYQHRTGQGQPSRVPPARRRSRGQTLVVSAATVDWKATLNLPKTDFPMRADLAKREPAWLERWQRERQYAQLLDTRTREEAPPFVLHDGPPYPTGGIHYGTVLNKVLKDIVVRSQ